jgi:pyruvate dehydrogenase E2 component (dihydrolipoamide acetyltransferase)
MANTNVTIPDLGGAADVEVIEICVAIGDTVAEGDSLVVLETDKASMEIPSPSAGVVTAMHVSEGATCNVGDLLVDLDVAGEAAPTLEVTEAASETAEVVEAAPVEATPEVAPVAASSAEVDMLVPDLGGAKDVEIIEVAVAEGDEIAEGDTIVVVETDKASMEIPASHSGTIVSLKVAEGGKVNQGDLMAVVQASVAAAPVGAAAPVAEAKPEAAPAPVAVPAPKPAPAPVATPTATPAANTDGKVHAGPAVRMLARELGADLSQVTGTGPKHRILKEDVQAFVKQRLSAPVVTATAATAGIEKPPAIDFSQFGEIEKVKMSKIHRLTAQNMTRSWLNVPHVTQFDHADITDLEVFP